MSNPMGIVTNNPSNIKLTPTMQSANMVGVNNVQPLQNITNPKSVGQPSANGYTVGSTNPNFKPFTDYKPVQPVSNPPQAIQTQASPVASVGNAVSKGLGILGAAAAIYNLGNDIGDVTGFFANYGQYIKNAQEADRLNKLIKEREKAAQQRRAIDNGRIDNSIPPIPPPFTGGQTSGVLYTVKIKQTNLSGSSDFETEVDLEGPIGAPFDDFSVRFDGSQNRNYQYQGFPYGYGKVFVWRDSFISGFPAIREKPNSFSIISVRRKDGQPDTGGKLQTPPADDPRKNYPPEYPSASEWPYGNVPLKVGGSSPSSTPNKPSVKPFPSNPSISDGTPKTNNPPVAQGAGFSSVPSTLNPQPKQSSQASSNSGFNSIPANQTPATQIYANGMANQDYNRANLQPFPVVQQQNPTPYQSGSQVTPSQPTAARPTVQNTTPTTSPAPASNDAIGILGAIAAVAATVTGLKIGSDFLVNKSLEIKNQTSPENLRDAAQKGSCDTLNSPSCTANLKNDIKTPILDKVNENAGALSALNNLLTGSILPAVNRIWDFLNRVWQNQAVDKVMQFITMISVIHNAAMLTRGIADTLGSAIDQGLQVFGLQLKDKDGNQIGVSTIIGQSVQNLIKSIIGADNYTALNETWIQANRIYQTGINLISNVQSIIDSTTAVAELTSNRLGTWMNAARNAGLVRENAYGAQSENVTKFNAFQNKLEALEQGVSNTAAITGNIVSVQQSVNELKNNRQEFDNALKNKPQGTGLTENDAEKSAREGKKEQSIYTIGDFSVVKPPENP